MILFTLPNVMGNVGGATSSTCILLALMGQGGASRRGAGPCLPQPAPLSVPRHSHQGVITSANGTSRARELRFWCRRGACF